MNKFHPQHHFSGYKYIEYVKARFPIVPLGVYTFLTSLAIASEFPHQSLVAIFAVGLIYLLFLFHLRVLDEFKDFEFDKTYHPDRPVQQGLISLSSLKWLGIINFFLLLLIAVLISPPMVMLILLFTLGYTALMFKEFYIASFLRNKPLLYLLTHQVVVIPLFVFFFSVYNNDVWLVTSSHRMAVLGYAFTPLLLIEIGRKISPRYDANGTPTSDTYTYAWGEANAIGVFALIIGIAGLLSFTILKFNHYFSGILIMLALLLFVGSRLFPRIITSKSMVLTTIIGLVIPFFLILRT